MCKWIESENLEKRSEQVVLKKKKTPKFNELINMNRIACIVVSGFQECFSVETTEVWTKDDRHRLAIRSASHC